jgi:hypothetical protein
MLLNFLGGVRDSLPIGADGGLGLSAIGYHLPAEGMDRRRSSRAHQAPWYVT